MNNPVAKDIVLRQFKNDEGFYEAEIDEIMEYI